MITLNIDTHRNVLLLPLTPVCTQQSRTRPRDLIKGKVLLLSRKHNSGPLFYSFKPQDEKLYLYINCSNEGFVIQTRISQVLRTGPILNGILSRVQFRQIFFSRRETDRNKDMDIPSGRANHPKEKNQYLRVPIKVSIYSRRNEEKRNQEQSEGGCRVYCDESISSTGRRWFLGGEWGGEVRQTTICEHYYYLCVTA